MRIKDIQEEFNVKRILVFSDTHRNINLCIDVIERIPADMIIHAGDVASDVVDLRSIFPDKEIIAVCGNNDFICSDPYDDIVEIDGVKIFITHGHKYHVKYEYDYHTLAEEAAEVKCDMAVFGHTHISYEGEIDGIKLLNPGSARMGSYGIIEIEDNEIRTCVIEK